MAGLNIDEFYADAAQIVVNLYGVFPRPVTLFAEDICGPDTPDEYGVHSNRHLSCFATFLWLAEEGYIRFEDTIRQDAIDQAVLSGQCFTALISRLPINDANDSSLPPSVAEEHASLVFQLERAVRSKSSQAIRTAFLPLLQKMSGA